MTEGGGVHVWGTYKRGGWQRNETQITQHNPRHIAHQAAESWIGDVLQEDVKDRLEQDVIAPGECGPKAVPVRKLLYDGEGGGWGNVLYRGIR